MSYRVYGASVPLFQFSPIWIHVSQRIESTDAVLSIASLTSVFRSLRSQYPVFKVRRAGCAPDFRVRLSARNNNTLLPRPAPAHSCLCTVSAQLAGTQMPARGCPGRHMCRQEGVSGIYGRRSQRWGLRRLRRMQAPHARRTGPAAQGRRPRCAQGLHGTSISCRSAGRQQKGPRMMQGPFCQAALESLFSQQKREGSADALPSLSGTNALCWPAASCSPTDSLRSTIGARGLNFWVRNGTRCASPAMAAGRHRAFICPSVPWGPHSARQSPCPASSRSGHRR
jgi:hypothetical protein